MKAYQSHAIKLGDMASLDVIKNAGHFEVIAPAFVAFKIIEDKVMPSNFLLLMY